MTTAQTPSWPEAILAQATAIKLLALDVDGVMTDGRLQFSAKGDELKAFNILDGLGIKLLMNAGVDVAVITGRSSPLTEKRMNDLGIRHLMQGREDKRVALLELSARLDIEADAIAYMGDDLPDLSAIQYAGLGLTVPNGHWFVRQHADYCTHTPGGSGAVREVCDLILHAQGQLHSALAGFCLEPAECP